MWNRILLIFVLLTWYLSMSIQAIGVENLLHTCVLQIFLFWIFRWPDNFFISLQVSFAMKITWASNKKLIPKKLILIHFSSVWEFYHRTTLLSVSVWHGRRSCCLLPFSVVGFALWNVSINLQSTQLPYNSGKSSCLSCIVGWFFQGLTFFYLVLRYLQGWSICKGSGVRAQYVVMQMQGLSVTVCVWFTTF